MKKFFFTFFIIISVTLFSLFSCTKSSCLYDVVLSLTIEDETLPAGVVMCYGRMHEDSVSRDTLSEYLGLAGYPEFADKIDELSVYSSVGDEYTELAAMRLYSAADIADGVLFFERRIKSAKRAKMFDLNMQNADNACISVYGNTVVLFITNDNKAMQKKMDKLL